MTKSEIISTLMTIRDDLFLTKLNLESGMDEHLIIKYNTILNLVDEINIIPNPKKKDVITIIKRAYINSYSKKYFTVGNHEENEVYLFMKQIVELLNIKM